VKRIASGFRVVEDRGWGEKGLVLVADAGPTAASQRLEGWDRGGERELERAISLAMYLVMMLLLVSMVVVLCKQDPSPAGSMYVCNCDQVAH
jgi:hypothetical protein